jgi:enamine deaminase RidA (YjgF/YER057c/UK114 family)
MTNYYEPNGRFSKVVEHNGLLFLSGQTCSDPNGDILSQTAQTLAKIDEILAEHSSDKNHILSVTVFLKDISMFKGMNTVYDAWVSQTAQPARTCVEAKLAAPSLLVEINCIAVTKD